MIFRFDLETTKNMVEKYYKENYDIDGELKISFSTEKSEIYLLSIHQFLEFGQKTVMRFTLEGKMKLSNTEEDVVTNVSYDDVRKAVKASLTDDGYRVKGINFDTNISDDKESEFNGVIVEVSPKKKIKQRKGGAFNGDKKVQ